MGIHPVVAQAEFVDQLGLENVRPTGGKATVGEILLAAEESAAIGQPAEGSRNEARLVFEAEAKESVVLVREFLVHANVKVVARFFAHGIGEEVVPARVDRPRRRIQRCQPSTLMDPTNHHPPRLVSLG